MIGDASTLPVADARRTLGWIRDSLRHNRRLGATTVVLGFLTAGCAVVPLLALGILVDRVTEHSPPSSLIPIAVVAGVAAVVGGLCAGATARAVARLGADVLAHVRESAVVNTLCLPRGMIERVGRGDLLSRINNDVAAANRAVTSILPTVVIAFCLTVVTVAALAGLDWRLGLAGAVAAPFYALALRWYLPRSGPVYADERRAAARRAQALLETINGRRTIRAYGTQDRAYARVETASLRARDRALDAVTLFTRLVGRANRAEFAGLTAILVVGFWLVSTNAATVGTATAAALLFHRLFNPIGVILYSFADLQLAGIGLARLIGVADIPTATTEAPRGNAAAVSAPALRDVHFGYHPGRPVLRGVDIVLTPGGTLALVGSSGAGKSTIASLFAGILDPDHGHVDLPAGSPIVLLSQETHVFAGPLIDDLRMAAPDADRTDIVAALRATHSLDWVQALPDGLDTAVGDGGHPLSEAQAQQVALARLILADPEIAILDEATAEAGSHQAEELESAARNATRGRTTLVIAHRLGQVRTADRVVVLADGVVAAQGTPDEILGAGGVLDPTGGSWRSDAPRNAADLRRHPDPERFQ